MHIKHLQISFLLIILSLLSCGDNVDPNDPFIKSEQDWRKSRDARMTKPTSWLTIAGLFWLEEGDNTIGSDGENAIILPAHSAPPQIGRISLIKDMVKVSVNAGVSLTIEDRLIKEKRLAVDTSGKPDIMEIGDLRFWIIERSGRYALRLRDLKSKRFTEYHGLDFYPIQKEYSVRAKLIPYPEIKTIMIPTVVGTEEEYTIPGYLEFILFDEIYRLDPFIVKSDSTLLFLIFKDETSGEDTYGAGRYIYPKILDDGSVDLNFNRAYNPPCAYTPYATCPLPPEQNTLSIAIEAGEKNYKKGH